jgi:hypothetical protein
LPHPPHIPPWQGGMKVGVCMNIGKINPLKGISLSSPPSWEKRCLRFYISDWSNAIISVISYTVCIVNLSNAFLIFSHHRR